MSTRSDEAAQPRWRSLLLRAEVRPRMEDTPIAPTHVGESSRPAVAAAGHSSGATLLDGAPARAVAQQTWTKAPPKPLAYYAVKRVVDIVVGGACLVVAVPVMLILAIIIRLDSPGPIIFRQHRLGENAKPFRFYKFRTMWMDARERFPELYAYSYSDTEIRDMYFKVLDDPRLTRFGAHLRKTSLDELPNFINVLLGDMTLVGPRPELPEMLPYYTEHQLMKFSVKPGVTGLAQVTGRAVLRFQQTITSDLEYCLRRSLWFDFVILVQTLRTIAQRVGAF